MIKKFLNGDIVLIPFPFSDLSKSKVRPAIILANDLEDFTCVFITTIKPKNKYTLSISPDKHNNLKINSYIRYSKFASLDNKIIIGKIGTISKADFLELKKNIANYLNIIGFTHRDEILRQP